MADSATWAKRVAEWRASGQTAREFASGRGFEASTLRWWASQLGGRDGAFVRVVRETGTEARRAEAPIELEVGEVRVFVRVGVERAALVDVLAALREAGR